MTKKLGTEVSSIRFLRPTREWRGAGTTNRWHPRYAEKIMIRVCAKDLWPLC